MGELKQIACDPACGFMVRSHDEAEVLKLSMEHSKHKHAGLNVTHDQLVVMITDV